MDANTIVLLGQIAMVLAVICFGLGFFYLYLINKNQK